MDIIYHIAFSLLERIKLQDKRLLLDTFGSAKNIYELRTNVRDAIPSASDALLNELSRMEALLSRAEAELTFMEKGHIQALPLNDERYPSRLRECPDAPTLLYYCGQTPLNATHVVSIVGTRQITAYGKDRCAEFVKELSQLLPDCLVVSGLAYGVDVHSHRAALSNGLPTVGVLAHGLEQIYPRMHRDTAVEMVKHGGLLTEYISRTVVDKRNFVQRNRIVAGICDAVVVVESGAKGGSLITARLALDYNREVFCFPGRTTDEYSKGCNMLIRSQQAHLLESAQQFVEEMGWEVDVQRQRLLTEGVQQELFPSLSSDEQTVMNALLPTDGTPINTLSLTTGLAVSQLSSLLFSLEMKGLVKKMIGNNYRKA